MGERDPGSFLGLLKRTNAHYAKAAGITSDEAKQLSSIRSDIDEETYKFMLVPFLAHVLTQLVLANDKLPHQKKAALFNCGGSAPDISVRDYMDRIIKYCPCSPEAFICAFLFIDRFAYSKALRITSSNVHRILLTSMMIASKVLDDCRWNNKYYSHVAGVPVKELLSLECRFLSVINYAVNVSSQLFETYQYEIELQIVRLSLAERDVVRRRASKPVDEKSSKDDKTQQQEVTKKTTTSSITAQAREKARMLSKKLKRSSSLNSQTKTEITSCRKRRSNSFNLLDSFLKC